MYPTATALRILRWTILAGFVLLGLYFLNDAFFSAWIAGGPPSDHQLGWKRRSYASLAFSFASLLAGVTASRVLARYPRVGRASWVLGALAVVTALTPAAVREVLIDKCLDSGGRWSHTFIECEH